MMRTLFVLLAGAFSMAASAAQSGISRTAAAPAATSATTPAPARGAPVPLGRFFFSPVERAQLDIARLQRKAPASATPEVAEAPPVPQAVTYGGLVRRSDGRKMLWLNNRLVDEKEALAGLNVKGKVRPDGAVTLQAQSGATVDVKVGQTVELYTGKVAETRKAPPETAKPPADAKAAPDDGKSASAEAKAPAESKPGAVAAKPPSAETPGKKPSPEGMGLKMDLGGRALSSEEAERISRSGK